MERSLTPPLGRTLFDKRSAQGLLLRDETPEDETLEDETPELGSIRLDLGGAERSRRNLNGSPAAELERRRLGAAGRHRDRSLGHRAHIRCEYSRCFFPAGL